MITSDDLLALAEAGAPLTEQRAAMAAGLRERGVSEAGITVVMDGAVDGVLMIESEEETSSRVGGAGSVTMPAGEEWPFCEDTRLSFLYEIAASDIVGLAGIPALPQEGRLIVFHDEMPGAAEAWLQSSRLWWIRDGDPVRTTNEGRDYDWQPLGFKWLRGFAMPLVGTGWDEIKAYTAAGVDPRAVGDLLDELLFHAARGHRLLGAGKVIQAPLDVEVRYWFQEPASECDHGRFSAEEREGRGWTLLLQTDDAYDREQGLDLAWGDGGYLYFLIPTADLARLDFTRVIAIMACH